MRSAILLSVPLLALLQGCMMGAALSPDIQNHWQTRPVKELEQRLGPPSQVYRQDDQKKYIWTKSDMRWVTIASGQKVAGFRMVNGRNVATTVNGPSIKNLQTVSCRIIALTDASNRIIAIESQSNGMSCQDLISNL